MAFGEVEKPVTEHSEQILVGSWPAQSIMAWVAYSEGFSEGAHTLAPQRNVQMDIADIVFPMSGAFIDAARNLIQNTTRALDNRIAAYELLSTQTGLAANALQQTKLDLVEIVNKAEEDIQAARERAAQQKADAANMPAVVAAIDSKLLVEEATIVATAKADAMARDSLGASEVGGTCVAVASWSAPNPLPQNGNLPNLPQTPLDGTNPTPGDTTWFGGDNAQPTQHPGEIGDAAEANPGQGDVEPQPDTPQADPEVVPDKGQAADGLDNTTTDAGSSSSSMPNASSLSPASSGSSSAGSSSSSPSSMLGSMTQPSQASQASSATSPSSGTSPAAGTSPNSVAGAQQAGAAGPGAARAASLAGLGPGLADSASRMVSGVVNTATNAVGSAANVGNTMAQMAGSAAGPSAGSPGAVSAPAAAMPAGAAPMGMMPAAAAPGAAVSPVGANAPSSSPAPSSSAPSAPAASPTYGASAAAAAQRSDVAAAVAGVPGSAIRDVGVNGANGDVLYEQASDAGESVVSALIAQTRAAGHIPIDYAVSLIWERSGAVSAWMATSEGPSYIPLGVRVPADVRMAVTDEVVGRQLWDASTDAGGMDPLEVVVRHAEAREMAAPGTRVLAIASSIGMGRVMDWAASVGARPVTVDPKTVEATAGDGAWMHRCAVAMPWDWRQANGFSEEQRLRVAARHMRMAAVSGHVAGPACEKVMDLFERRKPIDDSLWEGVTRERFAALTQYQLGDQMRGHGGADPARLLVTARAVEVIECLRNYDTAEGCADILYATRMAGQPLSPASAVA